MFATEIGESNEVGESNGDEVVEPIWVNDKSRDHIGEYIRAYNASDPIYLLTGTPLTSNACTSQPPMRFEKVEVLEKSMKDLEQARKKNKELFEEAIEKERKLIEEKLKTFKEEMIKDTYEKFAEVLTQLKEQPHTPHCA